MRKLPIALQVFSIREEAEKDFKGTMEKVKEMGYDGVELAGTYGYTFEEIKEILRNITGEQAIELLLEVVEGLLEDVENIKDQLSDLHDHQKQNKVNIHIDPPSTSPPWGVNINDIRPRWQTHLSNNVSPK